jgi:type II secretion system protein C
MSRYLGWLANSALFVLCCFLIADTANAIFGAVLTDGPGEVAAPAPATARAARSWDEREVILSRNLFNASLLDPAPPSQEVPEQLEATKLPLTLVGTVASWDPGRSWAVVQDKQANETLVVAVDQEIRSAKVLRIDPRRIVLSENGSPRELAIDEEAPGKGPVQSARAAPSSAQSDRQARRLAARERAQRAREERSARTRLRKEPDGSITVPREDVESALANPASLLSEARFEPKWEDGEMVGLQINAIQEGGVLSEAGVQNGDVLTELNGIRVDAPEERARVLSEISQSSEFTVVLEGADGSPRTINFSLSDE